MRYVKFRIRNFKGIKDTTVDLEGNSGARVFAFVGLNESGKTTIFEAIHSFSPDKATSELVGGDANSGVPIPDRVPRQLLSHFTGDVSVTATIHLTTADKDAVSKRLRGEYGIYVASIPDLVELERQQRFNNGDFISGFFSVRTAISVKTGKQKKYRVPSTDEHSAIRDVIHDMSPSIAYFPTFVFDFPDVIYLTEGLGGRVNRFYRQVFQDILDHEGSGLTIQDAIVRRVRADALLVPWAQFLPLWNMDDGRGKITHVMDRASAVVTRVVFGSWNKIFHEDAGGKEIRIEHHASEGKKRNEQGGIVATNEHNVYVTFEVKDGTRRFRVNDRSLGFRWFFAFMLFTQFRVSRGGSRPILFLFDEPASNLHAAAQQRLIESFPEIAKGQATLAYSTHSHYMIEPKWLEQTFIITNRADAPGDSIMKTLSFDDEHLDIQAVKYRDFVNKFPNSTSYFQPILDRLEVVPSRFDVQRRSVILEGKSDYYIIRYALNMAGRSEFPLIPGLGAGTFSALLAIDIGWGTNSIFILDGDKAGIKNRQRYVEEFGIRDSRIVLISELIPGVKEIEDLFDKNALEEIRRLLNIDKLPNKKQILRFVQERLASGNIVPLSAEFKKKSGELLSSIQGRISSNG